MSFTTHGSTGLSTKYKTTMSNGWIKIHRKITDNPDYFKERFDSIHAWIDLLLIANPIGEFALSISEIARRWKWERYQVQRYLKHLEDSGMIQRATTSATVFATASATPIATPIATSRATTYAISNYIKYQSVIDPIATTSATTSATPVATSIATADATTSATESATELKELSPLIPPIKENSQEENLILSPSYEGSSVLAEPKPETQIDYKAVVELWNDICGPYFGKVLKLTDRRKQKIKVRIAELTKMAEDDDYISCFNFIFVKMIQSSFFKDKWHPSFDWVIANEENCTKIIEGNYDNRQQQTARMADERQQRHEERQQWKAEHRGRDSATQSLFGDE